MMFVVIVILCCTPVSAADTPDRELAPPFDVLEQAFKVLQEKEVRTCGDATQIKQTLDSILARLDRIEATRTTEHDEITQKMDSLEEKMDSKFGELEGKVARIEDVISENRNVRATEHEEITEKMDSLGDTVTTGTSQIKEKVDTIKTRQQAWLSEVRLISLFKLTGENNPYSGRAYNPGLVVDGQYVFSKEHESYTRTYSHTSSGTNNKIWIDLGGLFRVYSVRVWNIRGSRTSYFEGTEVYVGDGTQSSDLIGTASGAHYFYDFTLSEDNVKYGSRVTLLQPRHSYIFVLEVQVWGNGPYDSSDKFN